MGVQNLINSLGLFKNCSLNYKEYDDFTEQELIESIRLGDEKAAKHLISRYSYIVWKIVSSFFIIGGDKDDLFQEAMIGLMNAMDKYNCDINDNFRCFAEICIRRQVITAIRKSKGYKNNLLNNSISMHDYTRLEHDVSALNTLVCAECLNPENVIITKEEINDYYKNIFEILSEFEKAVLTEFENGKSYEEISITLKKNIKSIDNAMQRIRKKVNNNKKISLKFQ